jgi:hypothetical protein
VFGREVVRLGYSGLMGNRDLREPCKLDNATLGWWSNRDSKAVLLSELRRAWAMGEYVPREMTTLDEAEGYIYYPSGSIGPAAMMEDAEGARKTHGDRVIRDGGLVMLLAEQRKALPAMPEIPPNCYEARRRDAERAERQATRRWA